MRRMVVVWAAILTVAASAASAGAMVGKTQAPARKQLLAKVNVAASEFKFVLSKKSAKRGVVSFKVTNVGKIPHDFEINGRKTPLLSPGKSNTLRVTFLRKGAYPYKCTVPGHAKLGMKGVFTIS
jgi:uncharacterized cupredoxin-like copper-binding protein